MTGEEIRALVDRARAAKAAGTLTPEMESGIMMSVSEGISQLQEAEQNKPDAFQERLAAARGITSYRGDPLRGDVVDEVAQDEALGMTPKEIANKNAQAIAHGVDIFTGAAPARLAVAKATGAYKEGDVSNMLLGKGAPSGADIVERYPSLENKPVTQALAATAYDILDPGLILGAGELLTQGVKAGGKKMFARGVREFEHAGIAKGKLPGSVTDTLFKYDINGNAKEVLEKSEAVKNALSAKADNIAAMADAQGAKVTGLAPELESLSRQLDAVIQGKNEPAAAAASSMKSVLEKQIKRIRNNPEMVTKEIKPTGILDAQGLPMTREVSTTIPAKDDTPNVTEVLGIKRSFRNDLPASAYDAMGQTSEGKKALKKISNISQKESEEAIGATMGPELQSSFKETNSELGNLLTVQKKMFQESGKEMRKNPFTQVDAMASIINPLAAGGKQAAKVMNSSKFLTKTGTALGKGQIAPRLIAYPPVIGAKAAWSAYQNIKDNENGNNK